MLFLQNITQIGVISHVFNITLVAISGAENLPEIKSADILQRPERYYSPIDSKTQRTIIDLLGVGYSLASAHILERWSASVAGKQ